MARTNVRWIPGTAIRILLVDSDLAILGKLRELLEAQGHEVFISIDPQTALLLAQQYTPHIICAGLELDGSSGYELAKQLRALPGTSYSVMIALAHTNGEDDVVQRAGAGFDDFLLKPLNFDDILHLLNNAINGWA
jgi:DNA-binding response OmpR family regulator